MSAIVTVKTLEQKSVMVVEDDYIQQQDIAQALISEGAEVVVFDDVGSAMKFLCGNRVNIVLLDLQIGNELSYPIADQLLKTNTPFVLLSGHWHSDIPERFAHFPFLGKPYSLEDLTTLLHSAILRNELAQ